MHACMDSKNFRITFNPKFGLTCTLHKRDFSAILKFFRLHLIPRNFSIHEAWIDLKSMHILSQFSNQAPTIAIFLSSVVYHHMWNDDGSNTHTHTHTHTHTQEARLKTPSLATTGQQVLLWLNSTQLSVRRATGDIVGTSRRRISIISRCIMAYWMKQRGPAMMAGVGRPAPSSSSVPLMFQLCLALLTLNCVLLSHRNTCCPVVASDGVFSLASHLWWYTTLLRKMAMVVENCDRISMDFKSIHASWI